MKWGQVAAALCVGLGLIYAVATSVAEPMVRSSRGTGATGYATGYDLLEAQGVDVGRLSVSPEEWADDPPSTLVLMPPLVRRWSEQEEAVLDEMLASGGRVIFITEADEDLPALSLVSKVTSGRRVAREGLMELAWPWVWVSDMNARDESQLDAFGGTVSTLPNITYRPWVSYASDSSIQTVGERPGIGPVLTTVSVGAGEAVWIREADAMTNRGIALADNVALWLYVAELVGEGSLRFDEYHQTIDTSQESASSLRNRGGTRGLAWAAALIYLFAVWMGAAPKGRRLPLLLQFRSSLRKELEATGELHRRAGHHQEVRQRLLELAPTDLPDLPEDIQGTKGGLLALAQHISKHLNPRNPR